MKSQKEVKVEIVKLLGEVKRDGIKELIDFLSGSDFFTAPASIKYHDYHEGGLAYHSLLTYHLFKDKINYYGILLSEDSIKICGLLHDMCKIGYYKRKEFENASDKQLNYIRDLLTSSGLDFENAPYDRMSKTYASGLISFLKKETNLKPSLDKIEWMVEDFLPLGHGEKSLFLISKYIRLTDEEACAIRWHMSFSEPGTHFFYPSGKSHRDALDKYPITIALFTSDFEARMVSDIQSKKKLEE